MNFALTIEKLQLLQMDHIFASKCQVQIHGILYVSLSELNFSLALSWASRATVAWVWAGGEGCKDDRPWLDFPITHLVCMFIAMLGFHTDDQWSSRDLWAVSTVMLETWVGGSGHCKDVAHGSIVYCGEGSGLESQCCRDKQTKERGEGGRRNTHSHIHSSTLTPHLLLPPPQTAPVFHMISEERLLA